MRSKLKWMPTEPVGSNHGRCRDCHRAALGCRPSMKRLAARVAGKTATDRQLLAGKMEDAGAVMLLLEAATPTAERSRENTTLPIGCALAPTATDKLW